MKAKIVARGIMFLFFAVFILHFASSDYGDQHQQIVASRHVSCTLTTYKRPLFWGLFWAQVDEDNCPINR